MNRLLTVCVGNVCRSPVAAGVLAAGLPAATVHSAGIAALVGQDIDATARAVAEGAGLSLPKHAAQQFTQELGARYDLILVLEAGHKREILRLAPQLSGRVMLLGRWIGDEDIPDPYRKSVTFHEAVFAQINRAADAWIARLAPAKTE